MVNGDNRVRAEQFEGRRNLIFHFSFDNSHLPSLAFITPGTNDKWRYNSRASFRKRTCPPRVAGHKCPI